MKSITGERALTSAREPKELNRGAHEPQPACPVDVLDVRDAVDGVDGAVAKPQPLTVEQVRHHAEVHREQGPKRGSLLEQKLGIPRSEHCLNSSS